MFSLSYLPGEDSFYNAFSILLISLNFKHVTHALLTVVPVAKDSVFLPLVLRVIALVIGLWKVEFDHLKLLLRVLSNDELFS